ncbi:MAG: hypothetical protein IJW65_05290 [Clostridia bacterium]|nr:hypothetical protein [Clostridia bacterium]
MIANGSTKALPYDRTIDQTEILANGNTSSVVFHDTFPSRGRLKRALRKQRPFVISSLPRNHRIFAVKALEIFRLRGVAATLKMTRCL